jgi:hypothetical protein
VKKKINYEKKIYIKTNDDLIYNFSRFFFLFTRLFLFTHSLFHSLVFSFSLSFFFIIFICEWIYFFYISLLFFRLKLILTLALFNPINIIILLQQQFFSMSIFVKLIKKKKISDRVKDKETEQ